MASRIPQVAAAITAVGSVTPWLKHDYLQTPFNLSLSVYFDSALAATLAVQYVADDQSNTAERPVMLAQAASTTATITDYGPQDINGGPSNALWGGPFGHGLLTGDVIFLAGTQCGVDSLPQIGYTVTVTSPTTYTVVTPVNQTVSGIQARVTSARVFTHQALQALAARANSNIAYPAWMSRIICTAFTTPGKAFLVALQGK